MRSTVARPSTWSVGTNRKIMSLGIPSDDAVLPWDTTRTPRWFAASMIAATSLLDCGPMISFTPSPASLSKPALARSGSCPVSTMSSVTCAFFSWWLRRLTATSSAARLVLPSDDPAPVIDSNAPTRTSVLLDCAGADSVPSANTDASTTTAPSAKGRRRTRRMRLPTPPRRCAIPWSLPGVAQAALDEAYALRPEHPVLRVWKARFDAQTVVVTPAETPAPRGSPTDVVLVVVFSLIAFGFAKLPWLVAGIAASAYLGSNGGFLATIPLAVWVVNERATSARASTLVVVLFAGLLLHANLALDRPGDANVLASTLKVRHGLQAACKQGQVRAGGLAPDRRAPLSRRRRNARRRVSA